MASELPAVSGYRIIRELGRGAVAVVHLGEDERQAPTQVAIKRLRPELDADAGERQMLEDEGKIGTLIDHPNIARLLQTGELESAPFLIFEFVDGPSYGEVIQGQPIGFHLAVLKQIAEGLHAAHDTRDETYQLLNLIHRDIKPSNILIRRDGWVKVIDFGVAAARGRRSKTSTGRTKGTLAYMAPEQIMTPKGLDRRADIFSLGVIAWEALAGKRLFRAKTDGQTIWDVVHTAAPDLAKAAPEVPPEVARCVMRCLSKNRQERPKSCAALAEIFEDAASAQGFVDPESVARCLRPEGR